MKKWLGRGLLALVGIAIVMGVLVNFAVRRHDRELALRVPPTLPELDELSSRLGPVRRRETLRATAAHSAPADQDASVKQSAPPSRLERAPSAEMLMERFAAKRPASIRRAKFKAGLTKILESALSVVSEKEAAGWAWERSQELLALGQWDEARRCFWVVLDTPLDPYLHRWSCAKLAWLEADPEMAARFLELSCQGDANPMWLANAVDLCRATGSHALADHYLARLKVENPAMARYYDKDDEPAQAED